MHVNDISMRLYAIFRMTSPFPGNLLVPGDSLSFSRWYEGATPVSKTFLNGSSGPGNFLKFPQPIWQFKNSWKSIRKFVPKRSHSGIAPYVSGGYQKARSPHREQDFFHFRHHGMLRRFVKIDVFSDIKDPPDVVL